MKKILFVMLIVLLLGILLAACGPSDAECENAWRQMDVPTGEAFTYVDLVLNNEWAPDSIGFAVKECIESGWDYR